MPKLIVDGKEIEFDKNSLVPLSDEELEHAHGGTGETGRFYSQLVCLDCGYASWWAPALGKKHIWLISITARQVIISSKQSRNILLQPE